jgi:hypothetical protein
MPQMMLIKVVFPAPFGPIIPSTLPGDSSNEMSRKTSNPPKRLQRCSTRKTAPRRDFTPTATVPSGTAFM